MYRLLSPRSRRTFPCSFLVLTVLTLAPALPAAAYVVPTGDLVDVGGIGSGLAVEDVQPRVFVDPSGEFSAELMVKVLDGRSQNGYWWVFYAGLTDVEYTLTVTPPDGSPVEYHNAPFALRTRADTEAIPGVAP